MTKEQVKKLYEAIRTIREFCVKCPECTNCILEDLKNEDCLLHMSPEEWDKAEDTMLKLAQKDSLVTGSSGNQSLNLGI